MKSSSIIQTALVAALTCASLSGTATVAKANTASTTAIVAGAAAIVGALLYDSSNRPYYVRDNHRYYVTQQEATYYRGHHHGTMRQAYVPEQEYPVARDPYHGNQGHGNGQGHMGGGHDHH